MKRSLLLIGILVISINAFSQKLKVTDGDLSFLKGVKELNLKYTYDDMTVGKYAEKDYVAKKKKEYNEAEAGRGDKWEKMWVEDREKRFEPKFEDLFVKYLNEDADANAGKNLDAEYTLTIHTYFTEPGYYIGISQSPAYINCEAIFVKSSEPENILAIVDIKKSPGRSGASWDTGERIKEAYAKAGKELSKFLLKKKLF